MLVLFLLGGIIGVVFSNNCYLDQFFSDVKITDIVQIIVTLIVAIYVTTIVNNQSSAYLKKREILIELLDNLNKEINAVHDNFQLYIGNKDDASARNILNHLKNYSVQYNYLRKLKSYDSLKGIDFVDDSLINNYLLYKSTITNSPFKTSNPEYSRDTLHKEGIIFQTICQTILTKKINMFH